MKRTIFAIVTATALSGCMPDSAFPADVYIDSAFDEDEKAVIVETLDQFDATMSGNLIQRVMFRNYAGAENTAGVLDIRRQEGSKVSSRGTIVSGQTGGWDGDIDMFTGSVDHAARDICGEGRDAYLALFKHTLLHELGHSLTFDEKWHVAHTRGDAIMTLGPEYRSCDPAGVAYTDVDCEFFAAHSDFSCE